jgi:triphosphoribosyl-dephospho-CoA synthase
MTAPTPSSDIERAFLDACRAELDSLKPGNVHRFADGHRMDVAMFAASARAAAPHIAATGQAVGTRIERAVAATLAVANCNTNLGIILLCAPLAKAAELTKGPLRFRLDNVLDELTVADASAAFHAIAAANPAGLGTAPDADVHAPAGITLLRAMVLARGHDRIANAYATDYAEIFEFALAALATARHAAQAPDRAITTLHMQLLSHFPDTHIARKHGAKVAVQVQREAARLKPAYQPNVDDTGFATLLAFDADLKARSLNPGTTADFVVATLFTEDLMRPKVVRNRPAIS